MCACESGCALEVCLVTKKWTGRVRLCQMATNLTNVQLKFCLHNEYSLTISLILSFVCILLCFPSQLATFVFYLPPTSPPLFLSVCLFLNASFLSLWVLLHIWAIWNHFMCRGEGREPMDQLKKKEEEGEIVKKWKEEKWETKEENWDLKSNMVQSTNKQREIITYVKTMGPPHPCGPKL